MNNGIEVKDNETLSKWKYHIAVDDEQPTLLSLHTIERSIYNSWQYSCEWVAAAIRGLRRT